MESGSLLLRIIEAVVIAGGAGIIAAVYRCILAYEPIMSWWFRFGNRFEKKWFFKPIWGCQRCIGGQMGLWFYVFVEIMPRIATETGQISQIGQSATICIQDIFSFIFGLLIAICGAIYAADKICTTIKN